MFVHISMPLQPWARDTINPMLLHNQHTVFEYIQFLCQIALSKTKFLKAVKNIFVNEMDEQRLTSTFPFEQR